jgi:hypothetical protein
MSVVSNTALTTSLDPAFNAAGLLGGSIPLVISGLQLWLDASDSRTITESSGAVSQWNDKSGNSNNLTQGTESAKPTTNATTQNGKNVLDFDGGDYFDLPSALYGIPNGPNTAFVVANTSLTSVNQVMLNMTEGGSNRYAVYFTTSLGSDDIFFLSSNSAGTGLLFSGITETNFNIIRARREGTTQAVAANNSAEQTNAGGGDESGVDSATLGSVDSGTSDFLTGSIAEMLIYNRSLSTTEILKIETYLSNKWGITLV